MPSLRHPVGPLPASIYWRRRFIVLAVLLAVTALVVWLTKGGGGDGRTTGAHPAPVESITPGTGPTSGTAITTRPGGSGGTTTGGASTSGSTASPSSTAAGTGGTGSSDGGSSDTAGGSVPGGTGGSDVSLSGGATGGTSGGGTGTGTASGGGTAGSTGTAGGTASGGSGSGTVQVNTSAVRALPICPTSRISLELTSAQNAYQPKDRPRFALTVHNAGGACRADLGRAASLVTVSEASDGRVWSSADCPTDRSSKWVGIAAGSAVTETFVWDRSRSTPQCPTTAPGGTAGDGVYLVEATLSGVSGTPVSARASFRLES